MPNNNNNNNNGEHEKNVAEAHRGTGLGNHETNNNAKKAEATKKALKTGAKAVANHFAPGIGGKAIDAFAKTNIGKAALNKGAASLNKIPGVARATNKLNDSGGLDALNKANDLGGSKTPSPTNLNNKMGSTSNGKTNPSGDSPSTKSNDSTSPSNFPRALNNPFKRLNPFNDSDKSDKDFNMKGTFSNAMIVKILLLSLPIILVIFAIFGTVTSITGGTFSSFSDAFGVSTATGGSTGGIDYTSSDPKADAFYKRVGALKNEYQANGKTIDSLKFAAIYSIASNINNSFSYDDLSDAKMREIADAMFVGNSYNEEHFKNAMVNSIFPSLVPGKTSEDYSNMYDSMSTYASDYKNIIGSSTSSASTSCGPLGSCTYDIKGFATGGANSGNVASNISVSNLKVQLMQIGTHDGHDYGGTDGETLPGEELVDFEKYVLGVAYQEIGPESPIEAIKAQMVAARSYILNRPTIMGGWRTLSNESGQWIIKVASGTQDQVYCDPDQGCSADCYNGNCAESYCCQWRQIFSGTSHGSVCRGAMAADSPIRTAASQTTGELLVDSSGYIINANFMQTEQNEMIALAKQGLDYKQILLQMYGSSGASDISKSSCSSGGSSCTSNDTSDYTNWKQYDSTWGDIALGNSNATIKSAGCLVTSIAMLIAKSHVATTVSGTFNPGTFTQALSAINTFDNSGSILNYNSITTISPTFVYQDRVVLSGYTKEQKLAKIVELLNNNYYVTAEVMGTSGQHWVAIDSVSNDKVNMLDPGSTKTSMWDEYDWNNTSTLVYFKAG